MKNLFPQFLPVIFAGMNKEVESILQKVYALYQRYGIKSVTMDDVARELGISKKTLYLHFSDKNDLVKKVYDYEHESRTALFSESKWQNAVEENLGVSRIMNNYLKEFNPSTEYDLKKYHPEVFEERRNRIVESMLSRLLANLEWGQKDGLYRSEMILDVIAKLYVSRVLSMMLHELFTIEEFTSWHVTREIVVYHTRGIATSKGIKILEELLEKEKHNG
jgi:AcrR family transcriptional regulator